jgi:hypothetical protein
MDFNPTKMGEAAVDELICFMDSILDCTPVEFFSDGRITRADGAVDLPGLTLNDVIVRAKGKQKHGVYTDRYGLPEMVYLGTPRSAHRVACYTKSIKQTGDTALRLEVRLKPQCLGKDLVALTNPLKHVQVLPVDVLDQLNLPFPATLLADSIRMRGIKRAVAPFEPKQRNLIIQHLQSAQGLLPDTDQLWAGWPAALIQSGLGKELGLLKHAVKLAA